MTPDPAKPNLRWYQLLKPVVSSEPPSAEMEGRFEVGKKAHAIIQRRFSRKLKAEHSESYTEPSLPCNINYHVDMFDKESRIVFEIKPLDWWVKNHDACLKQASGYMQFTDARYGYFILYGLEDPRNKDKVVIKSLDVVPIQKIPWEQLRAEVLANYAVLKQRGVV